MRVVGSCLDRFAEVGGVPYVFASDLDASMIDVKASGRASLTLSEASLPGKAPTHGLKPTTAASPFAHLRFEPRGGQHSFLWKEKCQIGTILGDPENPPCARLVLSGGVSKVGKGSAEEGAAMKALLARHPSFAHYPSGHDFYVAKLDIDGIWLIDFFGGAAIVDPADYFKAGEGGDWF